METIVSSAPKGNEKAPQFQGFAKRHLGPNPVEIQQMLELLGVSSLETLIDQTNKSLVLEMNRLSGMNSTTIDYNTELGKINDSRNKLDTYMEVDKLLSTYGHNTGIQSKNINFDNCPP
jgi:glycine cleavage system pyridoxal-binding protein P